MSENSKPLATAKASAGNEGSILIGILLAMFLVAGEPDVMDLARLKLMQSICTGYGLETATQCAEFFIELYPQD